MPFIPVILWLFFVRQNLYHVILILSGHHLHVPRGPGFKVVADRISQAVALAMFDTPERAGARIPEQRQQDALLLAWIDTQYDRNAVLEHMRVKIEAEVTSL